MAEQMRRPTVLDCGCFYGEDRTVLCAKHEEDAPRAAVKRDDRVKLFEVRDRATLIPCFGVLMTPGPSPDPRVYEAECFLLSRAGYGVGSNGPGRRGYDSRLVMFGRLDGHDGCRYDPYHWAGARTMHQAHRHVTENWNRLQSGAVIDVEHVLGEVAEPKRSERLR